VQPQYPGALVAFCKVWVETTWLRRDLALRIIVPLQLFDGQQMLHVHDDSYHSPGSAVRPEVCKTPNLLHDPVALGGHHGGSVTRQRPERKKKWLMDHKRQLGFWSKSSFLRLSAPRKVPLSVTFNLGFRRSARVSHCVKLKCGADNGKDRAK
jgi:hypothetical protein